MILRHGDILIRKINELPKGAEKTKGNVLAEGESSGHSHRLVKGAMQLYMYKTMMYLKVLEACQLIHQEHNTLEVPEGIYEIGREREYNPFEKHIQRVVD